MYFSYLNCFKVCSKKNAQKVKILFQIDSSSNTFSLRFFHCMQKSLLPEGCCVMESLSIINTVNAYNYPLREDAPIHIVHSYHINQCHDINPYCNASANSHHLYCSGEQGTVSYCGHFTGRCS